MGVIYCLTFPNGKKYIGQTIQPLQKRLYQHSKRNYCRAVYNAIQKYESYKCHVLKQVDNSELDYWEEYYISNYKTKVPYGYNIRSGGSSCSFGEESRKLMSDSHRGKKHHEQTKLAISQALSGRSLSDDVKQKISTTKKNSSLTEDAKQRMNRRGMKHTEEAKVKVSKYNKGKFVDSNTRQKLSNSLRTHGKDLDLPLYVHRKEQKGYHGSGYVVRIPGYKSKSFISKKMSDEQKYKLALEYLENIRI